MIFIMMTNTTKSTKPKNKRGQAHAPEQDPDIQIPSGHCDSPRCRAVWGLRVSKPLRCPRCGSKNIHVE